MTNPTSNYSFQMPTATDLVTDLPADFEVFGQAVDTRLKALNPATTLGDITYASATANTNTRLGIGTSGQVLAVSGGGVPAWTTTADVTPLTTKGDLFTFTTVDARLGVGANNTVLTADSAEATGLKWATPPAGSLTVIATGTMSTQSVTLSSIPSTYKSLYITITDASMAANSQAAIKYNAITTGYHGFGVKCNNTSGAALFAETGGTSARILGGGMVASAEDSNIVIEIPNYATAGINKLFSAYSTYVNTSSEQEGYLGSGYCSSSTAAISTVILFSVSSTWSTGTYTLYGVN